MRPIAINYTPDMLKFCQEINSVLYDIKKRKKFKPGVFVGERIVNGGKFGKKCIQVNVIKKDKYGDARNFACANYDKNAIEITSFKYSDTCSLLHELIHLFDPLHKKLYENSYREYAYPSHPYNIQKSIPYYVQPLEQNAHMRAVAYQRIHLSMQCHYQKSPLKAANKILKIIRSKKGITPSHDSEKVYKKYPKLWKKYINTLEHELIKNQLKQFVKS